jgi:SHS2 domain-containing protein
VTHRFLPHTADLIVELHAATLAGLFVEATSVCRILLAGDSPVTTAEKRSISLSGPTPEELILHFVRELLTQFQLRFQPLELKPSCPVSVLTTRDTNHNPKSRQ